MSYINLPVESFPDVKQPIVFVAAPYVGVAPSDMETLVVQPIEEKLEEITQIRKLTSVSQEGYANITCEFQTDIDVDEAVRKVREKLDQAKPDLPSDLEDPIVQEMNMESVPIMILSLTGDESQVKLKRYAEDFQDQFENIPGVLDVTISGGLEREVRVDINPARLKSYNIGVEDVIKAIQQENRTIPGGSTESQSLKWSVRVPGEFESVDELRNIVVKTKDATPIYLFDLAEVYFGFKEQGSFSRLNGKPSVTINIQKRSGENIIEINDQVKQIIADAKKKLPASVEMVTVIDQSKDIRMMVNELENNIIAGLLLVVFVLYFFMGTRNGLLVGIAIPISMLMAFAVISFLGYTLNMVVLFSLILALGMLVDNAVVIVENIYRHHEEGKPLLAAAKDGTAEVGMAVVVSTMTTLMAFLPLIFWDDLMGEFFKYIPITLIITLACSLVVGLVFNPVVCSTWLRVDPNMSRLPGDRMLRGLIVRYEKALKWVLNHGVFTSLSTITGLALMIAIWAMVNLPRHGVQFFPSIEPRQVFVDVEAPLGTRLEISDKIVAKLEDRIDETADLRNYVADVGSRTDMMSFGSGEGSRHKSRITIDILDLQDRSQNSFLTMDQVASAIKGIPGATIDVTKPAEGPPTGKAVEIQLKGPDFVTLASLSEQMMKKIADIPNITKLADNYDKGKPELRVRVDREKAALLELNTSAVANTIRTAINGSEASEYRVGSDEYDITVRFGEDFRRSYNDLLNLTVFHEGTHYPLANFASIELASGLSSINHIAGDRVVIISADALGNNPALVLEEAKRRLADFPLPPGYTAEFTGQNVEQAKSMAFLGRAFIIAICLIFFLLVTEFNSITLPFVILASVLLSFFGVFFGLVVTDYPFGIMMSGIGIISLAGVVVNNAIVLVDYIERLRKRGYSKLEAIVEGGKVRLRPVLLTAITTILGLIPLTVGINIDFVGAFRGNFGNFLQFGTETAQWWGGMGVVVIFGLAFATVFTLFIVPLLYYWVSDWFRAKADNPAEIVERKGDKDVGNAGSATPGMAYEQ